LDPTIQASERPQTHALNRAATESVWVISKSIYGFVQTMLYYESVLKENNFPAVLVESRHILFARSLLNYRMYNIIVLCLVCVSFPAVTPYILKQTMIFTVLNQTNSPSQAMTLLTSIRKVPIPNPLCELNIYRRADKSSARPTSRFVLFDG
jgi:hypothetical protein